MSLSRPLRTRVFTALVLTSGLALGGCSFSPVYSGAMASQPMLNLAFGKPSSRLEQIVYQELALRFGSTELATAPLVLATVSQTNREVMLSDTPNPNEANELTVTVTLTITPRDGGATQPQRFTRNATATYTTTSQTLANDAARTDAGERATKAATESLRLAILASLSR